MTSWPTVRLEEVATWGSGGTPPRSRSECFGDGTPWISIADLNDGFVSEAKESLTAEGLRSSSAKLVPPGTVLVAMYGSIGKLGVATREICTSQAIAFAQPDAARLDGRYLFHFLLSKRPHLQSLGRGGTQMNIGQGDLRRLEMSLPPIEEQRRIAAILDHAALLHGRLRERVDSLASLEASVFRARFAADDARATVADLALKIKTGPFGSQLLHSEFVSDGVAVLGLDNVVANEFRWAERRYITRAKYEQLRRYTVSAGDVLISIMGTVGRCVVVPDDIPLAINTKHICSVTPNPTLTLPAFLRAAFLWHPQSRAFLRQQTKGAIMDGLNMGVIKGMPIPRVSLSRQREFADDMAVVRRICEQANLELATGEALNRALQARAFSGRL